MLQKGQRTSILLAQDANRMEDNAAHITALLKKHTVSFCWCELHTCCKWRVKQAESDEKKKEEERNQSSEGVKV